MSLTPREILEPPDHEFYLIGRPKVGQRVMLKAEHRSMRLGMVVRAFIPDWCLVGLRVDHRDRLDGRWWSTTALTVSDPMTPRELLQAGVAP